MNLMSLVLVNLGRNRLRTTLTMLSVVVALFLFCTLRGVLDTLDASIRVGSEARLVTRNAISASFLSRSQKQRVLETHFGWLDDACEAGPVAG